MYMHIPVCAVDGEVLVAFLGVCVLTERVKGRGWFVVASVSEGERERERDREMSYHSIY